VIIPQEYAIQKFYQYAGFPKYKKITNVYEASCPICREGKSWGKKKRCYYLLKDNVICCHNCGWFSNTYNWIKQVSGLTSEEIRKEIKTYDILPVDLLYSEPKTAPTSQVPTLPLDSINLFDNNQVEYYSDNKTVQDALAFLKKRRIDTAANRPKTLWLSLTDSVHKDRVVIPFYDSNNDIIFYQSRALYSSNSKPKYLGKINGERSLYNLNSITPELDSIFIFEGPIDAFFVKNGTAVAGIQEHSNKNYTRLQEEQLQQFRLYNKVWVLDSQWQDSASYNKTLRLLDSGESVFIWPEKLGKKFKDINDVCIEAKKDQIEPEFILSNTHKGLKGKLLLTRISR
jgi:hypothetical protein